MGAQKRTKNEHQLKQNVVADEYRNIPDFIFKNIVYLDLCGGLNTYTLLVLDVEMFGLRWYDMHSDHFCGHIDNT